MRQLLRAVMLLVILAVSACGAAAPAPTATSVPPTAAPPTATTAPPTATAAPPTATTAPPTATAVPASPTPAAAASKPAAATKPAEASKPADSSKPEASKPGATKTRTDLPPELAKSAEVMANLKSYRLKVTLKEIGPSGKSMEMTVEYVAPDRQRIVTSLGGPVGSTEMIIIGQTSYMKVGPNWQKIEGGAGSMRDSANFFDFGDMMNDTKTTFNRIGNDTLDGEPCTVYEVKETDTSGKLWISSRDSTIRKGEFKSDDNEGTIVITDHNGPIKIEAPI